MLDANRFPVVFLFIEMPFSEYDVNVHPTKVEVRFYNSNLIHSQVLGVLRERLLGTNLNISAQLPAREPSPTEEEGGSRGLRRQEIADAMAEFFKRHRPIHQQSQFDLRAEIASARRDSDERRTAIDRTEPSPVSAPGDRRYLQIHDSYIVEQTEDGFVIIDQHALHERILYEQLRQRVAQGAIETQNLLVPEPVDLSPTETAAALEHRDLLAELGVKVEPFGGNTLLVAAYPAMLANLNPVEVLRALLERILAEGKQPDRRDLLDDLLHTIACKAAVKAGDRLAPEEIAALLEQRRLIDDAHHCPHGRPTALVFTREELDRQFKRG
jgi:DNA mismatch repair protein MutL